MILAQAEKELLVPYNAADKATPPKVETHEVNYFQQHEVDAILQAAESEPIKWKLMLHLMLVTGGRRGEMLGLTWDDVDFDYNRIHINKCVYYNRKLGIYIDKPITKNSVRYISLPAESMQLLREYRDTYYNPLKEAVKPSMRLKTASLMTIPCTSASRAEEENRFTSTLQIFAII